MKKSKKTVIFILAIITAFVVAIFKCNYNVIVGKYYDSAEEIKELLAKVEVDNGSIKFNYRGGTINVNVSGGREVVLPLSDRWGRSYKCNASSHQIKVISFGENINSHEMILLVN